MLRLYAESFLKDANFKTLTAANADEAIKLLETRDDTQTIFTDIQMPGSMDGIKLVRSVRDRWRSRELNFFLQISVAIKVVVTGGVRLPIANAPIECGRHSG